MAEEIVTTICWSNSAKISFNKIVEYLLEKWTEKEVENLVRRLEEMIST